MNVLKFNSDVSIMNEIPNTGLFIGDQWAAVSQPQLQSNGITHILNTTPVNVPPQPGIIYKQIPMLDSPDQDLLSNLEPALQFIDQVVSRGGKILIHCQAGVSRSASVLIAFIMWKWNIGFIEALNLVRRHRPITNPNSGFTEQLQEFENMLRN